MTTKTAPKRKCECAICRRTFKGCQYVNIPARRAKR